MKTKIAIVAMAFFASMAFVRADQTKTDVVERLQSAGTVLHELDAAPDKGIPDEVFHSAKCVAVSMDAASPRAGFRMDAGARRLSL
jgi:hypothetical protein